MKKYCHLLFKSAVLFSVLTICNTAFAQLSAWNYVVPVVITENSGAPATDYQVLVQFDTQTPITAGKMEVDGADLRVGADITGSTLLNFWVESGMNTISTNVWVKVPFIAANDSVTIYFFYGNPLALSVSNVDSVLDPYSNGAIPTSATTVANCIPFGNGSGTYGNYKGFTYQNIDEFFILPGNTVCFDLGGINDVDISINLDVCKTDFNGSDSCDVDGYLSILTSQMAAVPRGNGTCGDFELCFTADSAYHFWGQGIKWRVSPTGTFTTDGSCTPTVCGTTNTDVSGKFVRRFFNDETSWDDSYIGGFVVNGYTRNTTFSPEPSAAVGSERNTSDIVVSDIVICIGDSGMLTVSLDTTTLLIPPYTYSWTPTDSLSCTTCDTTFAFPTVTTVYQILVTDSAGTMDSINVTVTVATLTPTPNAGNDTSFCIGASVTLNGSGGPTYAWSPGTGLSDSTVANPVATPSTTTTYALTVDNGCGIATDSITLSIIVPVADAGPTATFCFGGSVQLTGTGGVSYLWTPNQFLSCTACDKTNANPPSDMTYYVTVTDSFGCMDTDSVLVEVNGVPISATAVPSTLCFPSDSVQLEVSGSIDISDNFDPALDPTVWTSIVGGYESVNCLSVSGDALYFDGNTIRTAETVDVNVVGGGSVDFWLHIADVTSGSCENADPGEEVDLDYSINGGGTWVNINTYLTTAYPAFAPVSEPIPAGAQTGATRFRWNQLNHSGSCCDHWAIDDVVINTIGDTLDSTAIINWSPGVTLDDSTSITPIAVPGGQMTYIVTVYDQGCITSDTITIYIDSTVITTTSDTAFCQGNSGVIGVTSNMPTASYLWSPAMGLSDTTAQFPTASPTSTTTYSVDLTNTAGCMYTDSLVVTIDTLPTASFTEVATDLIVIFTNTSVNGTSYFWDFGDGFLATVANPVHTYNSNGTYNVCLTAVNYCGTDTSCTNVTVTLGGCTNTVAAFDTITVDLTAVFTDMSTDATVWAWDFGDGGNSTVQNPVYTYAAAGTYNVCLVTTNPCSSDTTCIMVTITTSGPPCTPTVAGFTSNSVGLDAVFTDASSDAVSWSWDFGDASTSTDQNPVHTYAADGTYNVCLITTNACSSDTSCMNVTVAASTCTPATAAYTSAPSGLTVTFTDASTDPSAWNWDFGDASTSTDQNPVHTYASAGTYTVCLIVTNPCSADTSCTNITVTVCATPVASFTSSSSDLTVSFADASTNTTSWSWDFGDGNTSNSQNPTYSYSAAGTYNVCLTANSGCAIDVMCDSVTVTSCPAVIAAFTYSDSMLTVDFTDLSVGADAWSWDFGDGFTSTTQNASHTYASSGTYTVCLTSSSACASDNTCIVVTVVTVGLEESMLDNLKLFPNPTEGMLTVQLSAGVTEGLSFMVHNTLGEVVYRANEGDLKPFKLNGNQVTYNVDLRYLSDGLYLIQVLTENSTHIEEVIILK